MPANRSATPADLPPSRRRRLPAALGGMLAALALGLGIAAPDLDRMQQLAGARYGARASEVVSAWRGMIAEISAIDELEKLEQVNAFFNRRIQFEDDLPNWKQKDYWATPLELMGKGAGDCEDFAIAKYMSLRLLGIPGERLRLIYVKAQLGGPSSGVSQAHMVLGYFPSPTAEPLVLDNLISEIRPAARRPDLSPVFSFNSEGLWAPGAASSIADPTARLSRWRDALERMQNEGLQ